MTIGDRIKQKRKELHLTQNELANRLNTTKQTIYKYENNIIVNIPPDKIEKLANVLKTSPSYLTGWAEELDELMHELDTADARINFDYYFEKILESFGYDIETNYAEDSDGDTTVLFEGTKEIFEIKEKMYEEFLRNTFDFIDKGLTELIKKEKQVKSDFFVEQYEESSEVPIHKIINKMITDYIDQHPELPDDKTKTSKD